MKVFIATMAILMNVPLASAFAVDVGTLPDADFADTEVSTNIAISLSAVEGEQPAARSRYANKYGRAKLTGCIFHGFHAREMV